MATTQANRITPYYEQQPFLRDDKRYLGFLSGVGAGKSAAGVIRTSLNAELWNRGSMGAIVAPSTRMIKNAIFPVMAEFGLRDRYDFSGFQAEEPGFTTPDGGRIVILSADNERTVERLANLNLAYWWLDEAKETPKRAREILQERLRVGNYRNGYITTTPSGYDHNYEFFVGEGKAKAEEDEEHAKQYYDEYTHGEATIYETMGNRLCVAHVPSWANPHTPDDFHEEMQNLPEQLRLQQAEGRFIELGGGIYTREMFSFTPADELNTDWQLQYVVGVDPATEPDKQSAEAKDTDYWAATLAAVHHRRNTIYPIQSVRERGLTLRQGVNWVSQITADINCRVFVESNQSQIFLQQELQNQGVNAIPIHSTQNKEDRIFDLSIPIENGTIEFVNQETDAALGYDPRWQNLIQELLAFPDGTHDDLADSLWLVVDNAEINVGLGGLSAEMYDKE